MKRTKLAMMLPDTIRGRLEMSGYDSFSMFLGDVALVCRALVKELTVAPPPASSVDGMAPMVDAPTNVHAPMIAKIVHFERLASDLVDRENKKLVASLDFAQEVNENVEQETKGAKVALTVMSAGGPVFSSLLKPEDVVIATAMSSRSTSMSASPNSRASTAATSVSESAGGKIETISVSVPFDDRTLPDTVSIVKGAETSSGAPTAALKFREAFPFPGVNLQPPRVDHRTIGLKWGGEVGPGGIAPTGTVDAKIEIVGHWLRYRNHPDPKLTRLPPEPFRHGIGLSANFVAAYSSFAPERDETYAKVPAATSNAVWWERKGGELFRKSFARHPTVGYMFKAYEPSPKEVAPEKEHPLDEDTLETAVENFSCVDPALEDTTTAADEKLAEISFLLESIRTLQISRLKQTGEEALQPTMFETETYEDLSTRLSALVSSLPPHVVATVNGDQYSDLLVSKRLPLFDCLPVYRGTFPGEIAATKAPPPQVQAAAMTAMNAAAGLSPVNPAPVALMSPQQHHHIRSTATPQMAPRLPGAQNVSLYSPQVPMPPYQSPQPAYGQRPPYLTPQQQAPPPQQPQQQQGRYAMPATPQGQGGQQQQGRPRSSVPPPQGLGAIGAGYGGGFRGVSVGQGYSTPRRR
jgi:hypothetical protein